MKIEVTKDEALAILRLLENAGNAKLAVKVRDEINAVAPTWPQIEKDEHEQYLGSGSLDSVAYSDAVRFLGEHLNGH